MEIKRNDSFLASVYGMIEAAPEQAIADSDGTYDLYPVSILRQERDLFNRVRIRKYKSQLALPQDGCKVVRRGTVFKGTVLRTLDTVRKDGPFAIANFRPSTIFWINGLELTDGAGPLDAASPKPPALSLKTRIEQAFRRAAESGSWSGAPLDFEKRYAKPKHRPGSLTP
jgi:hypothetical protein